jgi:CheY-like chemotaxis protein
MTGLELVRRIRAGHPNVGVIMVTEGADHDADAEARNAGALAVFEKPVPLADFSLAVERALGMPGTLFTSEVALDVEGRHARIADMLANFRQDHGAACVLLLNAQGQVLVRAGELPDRTAEAAMLTALAGMHAAADAVARLMGQQQIDAQAVFRDGHHDLIFAPVTPAHSLLLIGGGLAAADRLPGTERAMTALRNEILKSLQSIGVTVGRAVPGEEAAASQQGPSDADAASKLDALLAQPGQVRGREQIDSYWAEAAQAHGNKPTSPDVISFEQAKRMGLAPKMPEE